MNDTERKRIKSWAKPLAQPGCSLCYGTGVVDRLSTDSILTLCACVRLEAPGRKPLQA